jgi:general secretion pathway protein G
MRQRLAGRSSGFTLVELLIVVIILGILAAVAIPQFTSSTDDARLSSLDLSLNQLRNATELYYHQHSGTYPGGTSYLTGAATTTAAQAESSLVRQLTLYSSITGQTATTKSATHRYGPYLKTGLPSNPFNGLSTIRCDIATTDLSAAGSDGTTGWKFYTRTGRLMANDGAHDAN